MDEQNVHTPQGGGFALQTSYRQAAHGLERLGPLAHFLFKRPPADAAALIKIDKNRIFRKIIIFRKSLKTCLGEVLVQFWIRIRILREKL